MRDSQIKAMVQATLLLTLAVAVQQLRLFLPLPGQLTAVLIGTLVNAVLAVAAVTTGYLWAVLIACLVPVVAFLQGQLPLPLLIPVVAAGNIIFVLLCRWQWSKAIMLVAPLNKALVMYGGVVLLSRLLELPPVMVSMLTIMLGYMQVVTGILGIFLARSFLKKFWERS